MPLRIDGFVVTDIEEVVPPEPARVDKDRRNLPELALGGAPHDALGRPQHLVVVSVLLFVVIFEIDVAAYHHHLTLPVWIRTGSADAERQVLIAIAAAVITVVGVVFSITILALTLASQQFGPADDAQLRARHRQPDHPGRLRRHLRLLGAGARLHQQPRAPTFVPYLSTSVAEALLLVDLGILIYFIHHIAKSIQLPEVIAGIADDLMRPIDAEFPDVVGAAPEPTEAHRASPCRSCSS